MTIQTKLKSLFDQERDRWLEENAEVQTEKVSYGNTEVEKDIGYSDSDWEKATQHVKEELTAAFSEVIGG